MPTDGVGADCCKDVAEESTSVRPPFVVCCFSVFDLTLLFMILLMNISFINISAVVDVRVGVVGLFCVAEEGWA